MFIVKWLIGTIIGRVFMGAIGTGLIIFGAWAYVKMNFVPKAKYQDAIEQIAIQGDIEREKERALVEDDKQADIDRQEDAKAWKRIEDYEIVGPNYPDVIDERDRKFLQDTAGGN